MLQLSNNTPFNAGFQVFPDKTGVDTLFLVVKATFVMGDTLRLSEQQVPIHLADEYTGEPGQSSLKAVSEAHIGKAATDILLYGLACSLGLRPVKYLDVGIDIGGLKKVARVYGNRAWTNGRISEPEPFANMPMVWERSFGGKRSTNSSDKIDVYSENPLGVGFAGAIEGEAVPNVIPLQFSGAGEDQAWGFGPIPANWSARAKYAGTYNETWQRERAPFLPEDFDPRFLNSAPPGQIFPGFLQGGEAVRLIGFHPDGELNFRVPLVKLAAKVEIANQEATPQFHLETLSLYPNQKQFTLTWRAAEPCPRGAISVKKMIVSISR